MRQHRLRLPPHDRARSVAVLLWTKHRSVQSAVLSRSPNKRLPALPPIALSVGAGRHTSHADGGLSEMTSSRKADPILAFTLFGTTGIVAILILALIIAALVFVVRRA